MLKYLVKLQGLVLLLAVATAYLFASNAEAGNVYYDLNYGVYLNNILGNGSGLNLYNGLYFKPLPKEIELHFQAGMPPTQLQPHPLEPVLDAYGFICPIYHSGCQDTDAGLYNTNNTALSDSTLASNYLPATMVIHGDWNGDGLMDLLVVATDLSVIQVMNNGPTTAPSVRDLYAPPSNSMFRWLLSQWQSGAMVPRAVNLPGNGLKSSLEFSSIANDASGNPAFYDVTPTGYPGFTAFDGNLVYIVSNIETSELSAPLSLADVNSTDPSQILPRMTGATGGSYTVGLDGSANYSVPLSLPVAAGNIQPTLAFNYSSNGGNGHLGFGWSLAGESKITRCGKTILQDGVTGGVTLTNADQLCLDGARLVLKSGTHGADGAEYRLENEVFLKIIAHGSSGGNMPSYFTVQGPDGSTTTYGGTSDSQILGNGPNASVALEWAVSQMQDRFGNYRQYQYTQKASNGSYVLREIDYGGNLAAATPHTNSVFFDYSSNPVGYQGYILGSTVSTPQILTQVTVKDGAKELRFYALRYSPAPGYGQAYRMESISECSGAGFCLSPTTFTWATGGSSGYGTPVAANSNMHPGSFAGLENYVDMNGDGLPDRVSFDETTGNYGLWVALNNGNGGFGTPSNWSSAVRPSFYGPSVSSSSILNCTNYVQDGGGGCNLYFADFNGDGLPDYVYVIGEIISSGVFGPDRMFVAYNTGTGFGTPTFLASQVVNGWMEVADLNGDGLADVAYAGSCPSNNCDVEALLTNRDGSHSNSTWLPPNSSYGNWPGTTNISRGAMIDVNGDGRADWVWIPSGSSDVYVALNTGSSFATPSIWLDHTTVPANSTTATDLAWEGYADLNGDGLPDRYWIHNYGYGPELVVALNNGTTFLSPYTWFYDNYNNVNPQPQAGTGFTFVDVNDDGLVDMVWQPNNTNDVSVALQEAGDFGHASVWLTMPWSGSTALTTTGRQALVDMNGDGLPEVLTNCFLAYEKSPAISIKLPPPPSSRQTNPASSNGNFWLTANAFQD